MPGKIRPPPPPPPPLFVKYITPVVQTMGLKHGPRTHWRFCRGWSLEQRQVNRHDCLPSLLDDGDKWSEIVYCEKKIYFVLGQAEQLSQDKISCTNQPTNRGRTPFICFPWVTICLNFNIQQCHPSLVSLVCRTPGRNVPLCFVSQCLKNDRLARFKQLFEW